MGQPSLLTPQSVTRPSGTLPALAGETAPLPDVAGPARSQAPGDRPLTVTCESGVGSPVLRGPACQPARELRAFLPLGGSQTGPSAQLPLSELGPVGTAHVTCRGQSRRAERAEFCCCQSSHFGAVLGENASKCPCLILCFTASSPKKLPTCVEWGRQVAGEVDTPCVGSGA